MALRYQYHCKACDTAFEEWHSMGSAPQDTECEHCGEQARRVWGCAYTRTDSQLMGNAWAKKHELQAKKEMRHIDPNE